MNLKYLNFGHIKGFNTLSAEQKDEFIALYKEYVKHLPLHLRHTSRESNILSVYLSRKKNYQVYFSNRSMALLKTEKKEPAPNPKSPKKAIATKQVRVSLETHDKLKAQAQQEGKDIREIIDLACEYYWDQ